VPLNARELLRDTRLANHDWFNASYVRPHAELRHGPCALCIRSLVPGPRQTPQIYIPPRKPRHNTSPLPSPPPARWGMRSALIINVGSKPLHCSHPSHRTPSHSTPPHRTPSHSTPSHSTPSHSLPSHSTPSHRLPSHSLSAIACQRGDVSAKLASCASTSARPLSTCWSFARSLASWPCSSRLRAISSERCE